MLPVGLSPGPARFLPSHVADAWNGAGGMALMEAVLSHRTQQHMAASQHHPPTHPPAMPASPGSGLLHALEQHTGGVAAPY